VRNVRIDSGSDGQRLDNFLAKILKGVPKTHLYRVIRSGEVRVNKGRAAADTRLGLGDEVRIPPMRTADRERRRPRPAASSRSCSRTSICWRSTSPPASRCTAAAARASASSSSCAGPGPRPSSSSSCTARQGDLGPAARRQDAQGAGRAAERPALAQPERAFGKTYAALVAGRWPEKLKVIDVALHKYLDAEGTRRVRAVDAESAEGRRSITLVRVAERFAAEPGFSLLDVTIKTGRTHQIRVHLADAGHVVVGDPKYGDFALEQGAGARHGASRHPLRAHVPACAAALVRASRERRADGARSRPCPRPAPVCCRRSGPRGTGR
jgi:23S rRNA pseudouridine955/2504/2580 synthase